MSTIVEVHAVRIQTYLYRSSRLRHVRGASAMLSTAFRDVARKIEAGGIQGARPVADAPEIDGKLFALVLDDADVRSVAEVILASLRAGLPAVDLEANWATGDHWVDLPPEPERSRVEAPPVLTDLPLARRCELCTIDPAVTKRRVVDRELHLCTDCEEREAVDVDPPGNGRRLAKDFNELGQAGRTDGGRKNNHLATVYIDGNRIGAFFRAAAESGVDRSMLAKGIVDATQHAWTEALSAVEQRAHELTGEPLDHQPVALHIMGGDDVLASMPACYGTLFAHRYLRAFDQHAAKAVSDAGWRDGPPLTASGGVVVSHVKHPFSRSSDAAVELCSEAKRTFQGEASSLAWVDLTGEAVGHGRVPWTLQTLDDLWPSLTALAELPASRRSRLGDLFRTDGPGAVRADTIRMDDSATVAPFLDDTASADLLTALGLVRWWS